MPTDKSEDTGSGQLPQHPPGKKLADTSFIEAVAEFGDFLQTQGVSRDIVWLFREEIIATGGKYGPDIYRGATAHYVRPKDASENEKRAEKYYRMGQRKGLGISLNAAYSFGEKIGCWIQIPDDELDGSYRMIPPGGLKFRCLERMKEARIVKNRLKWWFLKTLSERRPADPWTSALPSGYLQFPRMQKREWE